MKKEIIIAMPDMGNDLFRKYMKSKYVSCHDRALGQSGCGKKSGGV